MRIVLLLPPQSQLNTPYPSIAYLARYLKKNGYKPILRDFGIELALSLFSRQGLCEIFNNIEKSDDLPEPAWQALAMREQHLAAVDAVIRFLQGRDRTLAARILDTPLLPVGPRLAAADLDGFGPLCVEDAARHLATLYLADLADLLTATVDPGFALARYQHHLGVSPAQFDPLAARLSQTTLIDQHLDALTDTIEADFVGISVAFPGMLYGALRIAQRLRQRGAYVVLGGGYINTELRTVDEPRLWDYVDALCYDDGEGPLHALLTWRAGGPDQRHRTRTRDGWHDAPAPDVPVEFAADYADLRLDRYLSLIDSVNPAHRLWSDGRWNKLTLAHGCYWKKCSFCDIQLDYIARYVPHRATALVDAMEELIQTTGQSGFHLVDEAAPPRGMRDLAIAILARGLTVSWWGNIRFDTTFTPDLCRLLAASGLIAVTGGLEVASDRLLTRMAKGVTVEQVARVARSFRGAGVLVHAYLMYGFPTQTEQETIDAMEVVRQLFAEDVLSSAFWHRFVLTRHSGIYPQPAAYGVVLPPETAGAFAANDVPHLDPEGADHDRFDAVLPRALAAWMRGREQDRPVHTWFDPPSLPTREAPDRIRRALTAPPPDGERLIWLGGRVMEDDHALLLHGAEGVVEVRGRRAERDWLAEVIDAARPGEAPLRFQEVHAAFPGDWARFKDRWSQVRRAGLVRV